MKINKLYNILVILGVFYITYYYGIIMRNSSFYVEIIFNASKTDLLYSCIYSGC